MTEIVHQPGSSNGDPQPIRGNLGAPILGPRNIPLERENPALLASPLTDSGTIPNLKFSFAAAHNRLLSGGWAREVTVRELPVANAAGRREHAPEAGRDPRAALAQRSRVGVHARRPRPHHGGRPDRAATSSTTSAAGDLWNFRPASRTRSRDWRKDANSCWCSTTGTSPRTRPS